MQDIQPSNQMSSLMEAPLLAIALADIDITPLVFDRFFRDFPEYRADFYNLEAASGRMVNETIEALVGLADGSNWVATTITNFVELHRDYGRYSPALYGSFVDIVVDTLAGSAGDAWSKPVDNAWRAQAGRLSKMIEETTARSAALN